MNAIQYFILFLILFSGFLIRIVFILTGESSDEWASYRFIQRQKDSKWPNFTVKDSVVEGKKCYPILQHFIISKFPQKHWKTVGKFLNPFYDILSAILLFIFSLYFFSDKYTYLILGLHPAVIVTLLFLINPILLPYTARMRAINARTLSLTFSIIYFGLLYKGIISDSFLFFGLSIIPALLVILSSQFGLQVILFFSILLALLHKSWIILVIIFLTIIIGYLVPKVGSREALNQFFNHKLWYFRNRMFHTTAYDRNRLQDFRNLPIYLFKDFYRFCYVILNKLTPFIFLHSSPIVLVIILYSIINDHNSLLTEIEIYSIFSIVLSSFTIFLIVSIPYFSFLGEAERYFEYSSPAYCILFTYIILEMPEEQSYLLFWFIFTLHLSVIFLVLFATNLIVKLQNTKKITKLNEVMKWMLNNNKSANIATLPCKLSYATAACYYDLNYSNSKYKFYYPFIQVKGERGFRSYQKDTGGLFISESGKCVKSLEVFSIPLKLLKQKYNISHLIVEEFYIRSIEKQLAIVDGKSKITEIFKNEDFRVFELV